MNDNARNRLHREEQELLDERMLLAMRRQRRKLDHRRVDELQVVAARLAAGLVDEAGAAARRAGVERAYAAAMARISARQARLKEFMDEGRRLLRSWCLAFDNLPHDRDPQETMQVFDQFVAAERRLAWKLYAAAVAWRPEDGEYPNLALAEDRDRELRFCDYVRDFAYRSHTARYRSVFYERLRTYHPDLYRELLRLWGVPGPEERSPWTWFQGGRPRPRGLEDARRLRSPEAADIAYHGDLWFRGEW